MSGKNLIKEFYDTYASSDIHDPSITDECLKKMKEIAAKDPEEFKNLLKLFESVEDIDDKLNLSDVFTNLKYEKIKDFLFETIKKESYLGYKIWAAGNLIKFEDKRAIEALKKIIKQSDKDDIDWIAEILTEAKNKLATKLLLEFADEYDEVNKLIDRSYFEKKLKEYKQNS